MNRIDLRSWLAYVQTEVEELLRIRWPRLDEVLELRCVAKVDLSLEDDERVERDEPVSVQWLLDKTREQLAVNEKKLR